MSLDLVRQLLAEYPVESDGARGALPPDELRFILEYEGEPDLETERARVAELLESEHFLLVPLAESPALSRFLALRFPGLERVLPRAQLFAAAYEIADALSLVSCEPDLGSDHYADPEPAPDRLIETASILSGLCLADPPPPPDRRWALANTRIDQAWQLSRGAGVLIAQPDTGVAAHDELEAGMLRLDLATDILGGDSNPEDPLRPGTANPGHGTATASVAASRGQGQISGAAPDASIVPIRCIEDVKIFNASPVAAAIAHATRSGCHVVSMSLGGVPSRALEAAVKEAIAADLILVAAAGNCVRIVVFPARYSQMIAVAGSNAADRPWKGSSRGGDVDITAPAEFVWKAQRSRPADPVSAIGAGQGTSFSAALVAGAAALWLSHHGRAACIAEARGRGVSLQRLFRAALRATARRPARWQTGSFGPGILDAKALLDLGPGQIPPLGPESASPRSTFNRLLDEEIEPGPADPGFAWNRYGMEVAAIALAQAKRGASAAALSIEGKSGETRPSPQLSKAALESSDRRLHRFAAERGSTGLARPPVILERAPNTEIGIARRGTGLEGTGRRIDAGLLRSYLRGDGKTEQMRHIERILDALPSEDGTAKEFVAASARAALDQLAGDAPASKMSRIGLEALVLLTGRPALRVRGDQVDLNDPRAGEWRDRIFVLDNGGYLRDRLKSVGRIDTDGLHVGTGFVAGEGLVLTNRHVLQEIAAPVPRRNKPDRWILGSDGVTIDFADSPSSATAASRFRITEVVGAGPDEIDEDIIDFAKLDAALLRVETTNAAGTVLPAPSSLVRDETKADPRREVMLIGYPARPSSLPLDESGGIDTKVTERLNQLFGADYGTKYLSPGEIIGSDGWVLKHDSTSLGGSSGGPVVNMLDPVQVVGLHFGGHWLKENYAHGIGRLAEADTFLSGQNLDWFD